ncbi:hypothetical protein [Pseudomonas fluorescens]|uniref:Uncharacterized protein n=1 Tax=Pseudomonas fluorescens TaxID=294 RepID=A0A5E6XFY1_PSEFL|nr:hypothetical protein [Pseudomonas fluorescens]VVN39487.1 hypothetical protein PS655_05349 [Pseudomonas fluorescens]
MATEQKLSETDEQETDEPTEEEIEREKHKEQTWKHDDSRELSDPDRKF